MLISLMLAAFLMGLGGVPHCAAMCGAACAVVFPGGVPRLALVGRCLSYAILGAVAAASAGTVSGWGRSLAFIQPFWVMGQMAAFLLGLWMLAFGRMPATLDQWGSHTFQRVRQHWQRSPVSAQWALRPAWMRQLVGGMAWALLPCGLLYAALMTAALAPDAASGGLVMLCFAVPGAFGVWAAPAVLARWRRASPAVAATPVPVIWMRAESGGVHTPGGMSAAPQAGVLAQSPAAPGTATATALGLGADDVRWAIRLSGAMLAAMAAWGAYHLILLKWQAWCA